MISRNLLLAALVLLTTAVAAQNFGARLGAAKRGGRVSYEPTGPGVIFDALDPAVRKWYVPQELFVEYEWRQWEYSNYARQNYQRYVSTALEGDWFYDVYGNFLTRGWLIYDWRQQNPQPFGSTLEKSGQFASWFSNLVVASDHKGQYHYSITVGNQIRTTLTPMTFSKPLFNGVQWDFTSDKYEATLLLSRASAPSSFGPVPDRRTNSSNLIGGRVVVQVGDFVGFGGTFVNAHHSQSQLEAINGDIFHGQLTEAMNFAPVTEIVVKIKDEPETTREVAPCSRATSSFATCRAMWCGAARSAFGLRWTEGSRKRDFCRRTGLRRFRCSTISTTSATSAPVRRTSTRSRLSL